MLVLALETKPDLIIDDGADLVTILHSERPDLLPQIRGGAEETTTGIIRLKALQRERPAAAADGRRQRRAMQASLR